MSNGNKLTSMRFVTSWVACLAAAAGCTGETGELVPAPAPFAQLPGEWRELGPAAVLTESGDLASEHDFYAARPMDPAARRLANPFPETEDGLVFTVFRVAEGKEYSVRLSRDEMTRINHMADRLGFAGGSRGTDDELASEPVAGDAGGKDGVAYGWSNNNDSRIRRTATTSYPYRTIGTLMDGGGDCTGTRIGPRHVLTAAHCIYDRTKLAYYSFNFKPGRDGTDSMPYGSTSTALEIWVPDSYKYGSGGSGDVNKWDIALIITGEAVGNGWMGYAAQPGSFLDTNSIYMRGYPRCGTAGSPAGCEPKTLWGDTKLCEMGTFFSMDDDGWNREIETNCDGSAGQSGSAFYYYNSSSIAVAVGVFSQQYCDAGCPAEHDAWPNILTRITPEYLSIINLYRAAYPN